MEKTSSDFDQFREMLIVKFLDKTGPTNALEAGWFGDEENPYGYGGKSEWRIFRRDDPSLALEGLDLTLEGVEPKDDTNELAKETEGDRLKRLLRNGGGSYSGQASHQQKEN